MMAAAEIAKPAQYGSLYRHIIWTSKHIRSPYRIFFFFVFTVVQTRIPRAFGYFFCHLHDRCVLILGCTGDGCFLTLPSLTYYNIHDLFGRLKRTGKTPVFCFDKDVFFPTQQIRSGAINANYNICAPDDYLFFYFFSIRKIRSKSFIRTYINIK